MAILTPILYVVHVIVCLFLVVVVLLQSGKAADIAGAFGGMGSQTAFGPRGTATLLSKWTTIAAGLFMVTSLTLSIVATRNAGTQSSVTDRVKQNQSAPANKSNELKVNVQQDKGTKGETTTVPLPMPPAGDKGGAPANK
jgi:preprotein translocase subunit SecG